uniref:Uncharacterized protein n=1 Tax=Arundo donax TaxID=35708 RepID=A0A0A9CGH8_ARUDO
MQQDCSRSS